MGAHDDDEDRRCAWCAGLLPAPSDVLVIVRPSDGETVKTCSAACLGAWMQDWPDGLRQSRKGEL